MNATTTPAAQTGQAIEAAAEHAWMERYAQMKHTAYAAEVAEVAAQLRKMADDVERYGADIQYANEAGPDYLRAATRVISAVVDNASPRVSSIVTRAAEAQAARADLATWESAH